MNAILKISPRELKQAREELYQEKKREWLFFVQAITEANQTTGTALHRAFIEGEAVTFLEYCERAVKEYIEACGMNETAEVEAQGRKERG